MIDIQHLSKRYTIDTLPFLALDTFRCPSERGSLWRSWEDRAREKQR